MKIEQAVELASKISYVLYKESSPTKRYDMYVLQESLLTECEDLDYNKLRWQVDLLVGS